MPDHIQNACRLHKDGDYSIVSSTLSPKMVEDLGMDRYHRHIRRLSRLRDSIHIRVQPNTQNVGSFPAGDLLQPRCFLVRLRCIQLALRYHYHLDASWPYLDITIETLTKSRSCWYLFDRSIVRWPTLTTAASADLVLACALQAS